MLRDEDTENKDSEHQPCPLNEVYNWNHLPPEFSDGEDGDDIPASSPALHAFHTVEQPLSSSWSSSSDSSNGYERVNDVSELDEPFFINSDEDQDEDEHGYQQMPGDLVSAIETLLTRNKNEIIDFVNKELAGIKNHIDRSIQSSDYNCPPYVHPFPHFARYRPSDQPPRLYQMDSGIHGQSYVSMRSEI